MIGGRKRRMNEYLRNLNRIEYVVTLACTGRCKHCQEGDHDSSGEHLDPEAAVNALRQVCGQYAIETVMTFGGEPLLFLDVVAAIHRAAAQMGVGKRQVITNGYFSRKPERIEAVARSLKDSGVNDLLLSVDAFHQETIPLEPVKAFAQWALRLGIPLRLNPAWLVSPQDGNPYNLRTRAILRAFEPLGVPVGEGDMVFAEGNALKYLGEYLSGGAAGPNPYEDDPRDVRSLSFLPNGDVLHGNIYARDILDIMETYRP